MIDDDLFHTIFEKSLSNDLSVTIYDCAGNVDLHIPSGRFLAIEYIDENKCSKSCEMSIEEAKYLYRALKEYFVNAGEIICHKP